MLSSHGEPDIERNFMTAVRISTPVRLFTVMAMATLFAACAPTNVVNEWHMEGTAYVPRKVAVISVLPDALIRQAVETDVAAVLRKRGMDAIASSKIKGMAGGIRGQIDPERAEVLLSEAGVDGVVVMFYTGGGRGEDLIKNNYYASYIGTGLGYSWASPHFVSVYEIRRGDEIAAFKTSAYVESSYHDLRNGNAVWRIITQTKDTEHADTAESVARHIASQMSKFGLN